MEFGFLKLLSEDEFFSSEFSEKDSTLSFYYSYFPLSRTSSNSLAIKHIKYFENKMSPTITTNICQTMIPTPEPGYS
jgi:hypothetical protein